METLTSTNVIFEEVKQEDIKSKKNLSLQIDSESKKKDPLKSPAKLRAETIRRPETVNAKVYKLKSRFVKESLYVTLSYIEDENAKKGQ